MQCHCGDIPASEMLPGMSQVDMFYNCVSYVVFKESLALNTLNPLPLHLPFFQCPFFASHALRTFSPYAPKQFCAFAKELGQAITANAGIAPI